MSSRDVSHRVLAQVFVNPNDAAGMRLSEIREHLGMQTCRQDFEDSTIRGPAD